MRLRSGRALLLASCTFIVAWGQGCFGGKDDEEPAAEPSATEEAAPPPEDGAAATTEGQTPEPANEAPAEPAPEQPATEAPPPPAETMPPPPPTPEEAVAPPPPPSDAAGAVPPPPPPPPEKPAKQATRPGKGGKFVKRFVSASELRVRAKPNTTSKVLRKVRKGQALQVSVQGKWAKLKDGGYVSTKYLSAGKKGGGKHMKKKKRQ